MLLLMFKPSFAVQKEIWLEIPFLPTWSLTGVEFAILQYNHRFLHYMVQFRFVQFLDLLFNFTNIFIFWTPNEVYLALANLSPFIKLIRISNEYSTFNRLLSSSFYISCNGITNWLSIHHLEMMKKWLLMLAEYLKGNICDFFMLTE